MGSRRVVHIWLLADQTRGSSDYAQELNLGVRWAISRNLYFLGVAGIAFPGDNLKQQAGSDLKNWTTVHASVLEFLTLPRDGGAQSANE